MYRARPWQMRLSPTGHNASIAADIREFADALVKLGEHCRQTRGRRLGGPVRC